MGKIKGKDITLKIGTKFFTGVTDTDFSGSVKWLESLIKEDDGKTQKEVDTFDEKFNISGITSINETGQTATHTDWAGLRTAYRAGASIAFVYGMFATGKPEITGNLRINSFNEKAGASGYATYTLECEVIQDSSLTYHTTSGS